ncbi:MAG: exo-alpha-sialidase [Muribaculaceae bacterium]|nr:exo-alpha-sialidase [Muribaculaceae bacterium]
MNPTLNSLLLTAVLSVVAPSAMSTDLVHYSGSELSDPNRHDGGLSPVVGVHNIQTMRASRRYDMYRTNENGWTYNHQPMLAYWNGRFYMHYLSNPVDEHVGGGRTMLQTSVDGYTWTAPEILFPLYPVPAGFSKPDSDITAPEGVNAVMHQRVGFYVSKSGRLLATGNYGVALHPKDDPNDGNGIGRVVREIYPDGSFGPIYFVYYNHGFSEKNTLYPFYTASKDKGFRQACSEMVENPLYRMQWVEEADRNDPLIPLKNLYKAFCWYTLPDGRVAGLWKHALTSVSSDGGNTWHEPVLRAKGFVNSNAKIWGQRLSDGTYATVYNPSEFRWPLAISLSEDGLDYTTLNLVHGRVPAMRYAGQYKSFGPQYVRGIQEGNGTPPDGDLWVTYSVGKEDMWVARIPVPVQTVASAHADEDFADFTDLAHLTMWNIYSPVLAPVSLEQTEGRTWLTLADSDPFDLAMVERKIPPSRSLSAEFDLMAWQNDHGTLLIEFVDENGVACSRIELTPDGVMRSKGGARYGRVIDYEPGKVYNVKVDISLDDRQSTVWVDGKKRSTRMLFAPVKAVERVVFRTGSHSDYPNVDTAPDQTDDMPRANDTDLKAVFSIAGFKTSSSDPDATAAVLRYDDYAHHADYFNSMEDENIVQAIPNSESSEWMRHNIPLFDCPDRDFEQIYYYRWWTLRKHIRNTPVGYGMTEFLVNRSYADRYNLIACAIGHHIMESRWLRNPEYLDGIINTWYHGNNGKPMEKMMKFSSWNPYAVYSRWLVDADTAALVALYPDLKAEYTRWEETHRLDNGLYWQRDVSDGMEESISGGRRTRNARPTINSYMYGNAVALAEIASLLGDEESLELYSAKARELKYLVQTRLWNQRDTFFETLCTDTLASAREAIGYVPWYFNLPDSGRYDNAWLQIADEKGFLAPYGLTTAERRHPQFRTHGVGQCEWDGAVWPFATSQTLTALANYLNSTESPVVTDSIYFGHLKLLVESQHHRGRPYIGEYLDETTGYWLKGDQERSRYYNHSTFNDLVITGLCGLRPRPDRTLEINPLLPAGTWPWFCLDNIPYHGHNITILWDETGERYHKGPGLTVMIDGRAVANAATLDRIVVENAF